MYLFGSSAVTETGNDVALPGSGVVLAEYLDVHFFPEHAGQLGAILPKEEVGDDAASLGSLHADDVLPIHLGIAGKNFSAFIGLCQGRCG